MPQSRDASYRSSSGRQRLELEALEARLLLSAWQPGIGPEWFGAVPSAGPASADEPAVVTLQWRGEDVTAREDCWIVQLTAAGAAAAGTPAGAADVLSVGAPGFRIVRGLGREGLVLVSASGAGPAAVDAWLAANPAVLYYEPDLLLTPTAVPSDPDFGLSWALENTGQSGGVVDADMDAVQAWDISTGSGSVVIGIIDTGVALDHPDLVDNLWVNPGEIADNGLDDDGNGFVDDVHGYDFGEDDGDPGPGTGHGTHVAGIAGAVGDNGIGLAGVAWDCSIMALKFYDDGGTGYSSDAVRALNYAAMMRQTYGVNVRVTNNSWGSDGYSTSLRNAIADNGAAGIMFVAAAGNDGRDIDSDPFYPASYDLDNVVTVASTNASDALAGSSSYGATSVDLAAPGVQIYSTKSWGGYGYGSGTSFAAPHVAGLAALLWSADPDATVQEVKDALLAGTDPVAALEGKTVSGGRANAYGALLQLSMSVAASDPAAGEITHAPPVEFALDFTEPYDPATVDAADLLVNGIPADDVEQIDADTLLFSFDVSPVVGDGEHTMSMAADVLVGADTGRSLAPWHAVFHYDSLVLAVTTADPPAAATLESRPAEIVLQFNEAVDPASLDPGDLVLNLGTATSVELRGDSTAAFAIDWDEPYGNVSYTLGEGAVTDAFGFGNAAHTGEFVVLAPNVEYYGLSDLLVPITAGTTVNSAFDIAHPREILDVDVLVKLDHTELEALSLVLVAPDGTRVPLAAAGDLDGVDLSETILDDEADEALADGAAPYTGRFRPASPLSVLDGSGTLGTWQLEVTYSGSDGVGVLKAWGVYMEWSDEEAPLVAAHRPAERSGSMPYAVWIEFSEPMDPESFAVADDVLSFVGPAGDLAGAISGYAWQDSQTLRISFAIQSEEGYYSLTLGPGVADAAGNLLNQDGDSTPGEPGEDGYTANFRYGALPQVAVVLAPEDDTGVSDADAVTAEDTPSFEVTVNKAGTISIDWESDGTVDVVSAVGDGGTYGFTPAAPFGDGIHETSVVFSDGVFADAEASTSVTVDTLAPAAPDAPALAPGSDSGASDSDGITNVATPTILLNGAPEYWILTRDGVPVGPGFGSGASYADVLPGDGSCEYVLYAADAAGNVSDASAPFTVVLDTTPPVVGSFGVDVWTADPVGEIAFTVADAVGLWEATVEDPSNYSLWGAGGQGVFGDGNDRELSGSVASVDYSAATGDVVVSLGAAATADAFQFTIDGTGSVRDLAGNVLDGDGDGLPGGNFTATFTAWALLREVTDGAVTVRFYDTDGTIDADPSDLRVVFGGTGQVRLIELRGDQPMDGLAIVVTGGTVDEVRDSRSSAGDVAFIAVEEQIGSIGLDGGFTGYRLNGLAVPGMTFDADIDGDGRTDDLVSLYAGDYVQGNVKVQGAMTGDVWIAGANAYNWSLKVFHVLGGAFAGDFRAPGKVGVIKSYGDYAHVVDVGPELRYFLIYGGDLSGVVSTTGPMYALLVDGGGIVNGADVTVGGVVRAGNRSQAWGVPGESLHQLVLRNGATFGAGANVSAAQRIYFTGLDAHETSNGGEGFGITAGSFGYVRLGGSYVSTPYDDGDFRIVGV